MKIRSITAGTQIDVPPDGKRLAHVADFLRASREACQEAGMEVETVRLATQPITESVPSGSPAGALALAQQLQDHCERLGIEYCTLGPVLADRSEASLSLVEAIPKIIQKTTTIFAAVLVASRQRGINLRAIDATARAIKGVSQTSQDGFGNLRLAALANCPPHSPFFPAAYHAGAEDAFSVALESADLAVEAFTGAHTLEEARDELRRRVEEAANSIERLLAGIGTAHDVKFLGTDLSLAPFPSDDRSIATAVERLGVSNFGASGTLFVSALIADVLRKAKVKKCGFSGLMYPLLEDSAMARRAAQESYTLDSLLLYSAVCGTGLDTIPLPGEISTVQLGAILLDVAALATVLDKPLTARLLPIPGKRAGEMTNFSFPYFANARILDVGGTGAAALLSKGDFIGFSPLHRPPATELTRPD